MSSCGSARFRWAMAIVLGVGALVTPAIAGAENGARARDAQPLPRYATPEEQKVPLPQFGPADALRASPPGGTIHTPAEYEFGEGLLVSWQGYSDVLTAMVVGLTTRDPEAIAYVVVASTSEESSVSSSLTSAGADMNQVSFIVYNSPNGTDSVWMRDYGPRFIFEDGVRAIVDHEYNRPRPDDDAFPGFLGTQWGETVYDMPIVHGGGNFHLFSNGEAFMTSLVLNENPGYTEQDVKNLFHQYLNVDLTIYPGFPTNVDSTQHIDMWMQPLSDTQVLIGQYSGSSGYEPEQITDDAAADLAARGYTVYRVPGWNSGSGGYDGTHYTYTNAVVLNNIVFIPEFGGSYTSQDATAVSVFETALPDHDIVPVNCADIIHAAGALHCVVMHVPGYVANLRVTPPAELEAAGAMGGPFTPNQQVYTLENTSDAAFDFSVTPSTNWVSATPASGTLPAGGTTTVTVALTDLAQWLGNGVHEDTVSFVNETDHNGDTVRTVTLTVGVPQAAYSFPMDTDPGWSTEGLWDWGVPQGLGGDHGSIDPTSGYTGSAVYGYNLNGDYEADLPERNLTSTVLDCGQWSNLELRFQRWLGVEQPQYDHAYVRISTDGTNWTTLWQNSVTVDDGAWVPQSFDISAIADGQPTVYLRWTMGTSDSSWQYCGWNLDDVELWGIPAGAAPGDYDDDGDVDLDDYAALSECLFGPDVVPAPAPPVTAADCQAVFDFDDDTDVDLGDYAVFQMIYRP